MSNSKGSMSQALIQDYLHTQGLKLPLEAVQIAYATLGAVFNLAEVKDLPANLWQDTAHEDGCCFISA
jgi:hypothetical protein